LRTRNLSLPNATLGEPMAANYRSRQPFVAKSGDESVETDPKLRAENLTQNIFRFGEPIHHRFSHY
jgi:hypothetical protein